MRHIIFNYSLIILGFLFSIRCQAQNKKKITNTKMNITEQIKKLTSKLNDPTLEKEVITAFNNGYANYPDENFTGAKGKKVIFMEATWEKDDFLRTDIIPAIIIFHHEKKNKCYAYYVNLGKMNNKIAFAYKSESGITGYTFEDGNSLPFFKPTEINCSIIK